MNDAQKKIYKSGIRAINQGTRYDITGNLRRLARKIERGELGDVRTVVVCITDRENGGIRTHLRHFGNGTISDALYTLEAAKTDITQ